MKPGLKVLLVGVMPADCGIVVAMLGRQWPDLTWDRVESAAAFRAALAREPDIIIADLEVPEFGAVVALRILSETGSRVPLLVYTAATTNMLLDQCIRLGAAGCLLKDDRSRLVPTVHGLLHPQLIAAP